MAKLKLVGKRERLILGKWVVPGEIVSVPDKTVRSIVDRLGNEIEVTTPLSHPKVARGVPTANGGEEEKVNDDDTGRADGAIKRSGTGKKRRARR